MEFKRGSLGLYYYDLRNFIHHEHRVNDKAFSYLHPLPSSFLQTVEGTKSLMSANETKQANTAQMYQEILQWPSTNDYKHILSHNLANNGPVNVDDVKRALDIYGEPIPLLRGKMKRPSPLVHDTMNQLPLPPKLHDLRIALHSDILFVNSLPFLLTKSDCIGYARAWFVA